MSNKTTSSQDIKSTLIMPMQSVGNCGKSNFISSVIEYLKLSEYTGDILALDSDAVHTTLKKWYGVDLIPFNTAGDFHSIYNLIEGNVGGIKIVDMPAQATDQLLEAFEKYNVLEMLEETKTQLVVPIFMTDTTKMKQSALKLVMSLPNAKFILIGCSVNPYKSFIESEKLMAKFKGCPIIELPPITEISVMELEKQGVQAREEFSFTQASSRMKGASRAEYDHYANRAFVQLEENLGYWLHDPENTTSHLRLNDGTKEELDLYDF